MRTTRITRSAVPLASAAVGAVLGSVATVIYSVGASSLAAARRRGDVLTGETPSPSPTVEAPETIDLNSRPSVQKPERAFTQ